MGRVMIHHAAGLIPWHRQRLPYMQAGLERLGFEVSLTTSRCRWHHDPAILFGTTLFKQVEKAPGNWLLVDRACFGDPEYVSLGWNGHGAEADYKLPAADGRLDKLVSDGVVDVKPMKTQAPKSSALFCDYGWSVDKIKSLVREYDLDFIKMHPADSRDAERICRNIDAEPLVDVDACTFAVVGASTVGAQLLAGGVYVVPVSEQSLINGWWRNGHQYTLERIAWTQWSWDEIQSGEPITHLFEWLRDGQG